MTVDLVSNMLSIKRGLFLSAMNYFFGPLGAQLRQNACTAKKSTVLKYRKQRKKRWFRLLG